MTLIYFQGIVNNIGNCLSESLNAGVNIAGNVCNVCDKVPVLLKHLISSFSLICRNFTKYCSTKYRCSWITLAGIVGGMAQTINILIRHCSSVLAEK